MSQQTELKEMKNLVQALPRRRVPAGLHFELRIAASKEAADRRRWASAPELLVRLKERFRLWQTNMMRPLALPCAGGLTVAVLVFTMFVHTYPVRAHSVEGDTPTALYTGPSAKTLAPFEPPTADAELEVMLDEQGRISDYRVVAGSMGLDVEVRRSVERTLLFTEFTPATSFGQTVASKLRLTLRRGSSSVTVKG